MASQTKASSSRINDHALAVGIKAYEHKTYGEDADVLWVWYVSKYCNGDPLAKIVGVTVDDLVKMRDIIDDQIDTMRDWERAAGPQPPDASTDQ